MTNRRGLTAFYLVVALIALAGQALAAVEWLGWPLISALAAVAALELGGVVLSQHALARMRLGETATAARLLSAAVAGFAVAFNWAGHADHRQGAFFAGMSALGYLVWLLDAGSRRRDQLRALRMLADTAPAYGLAQWLRHPGLTREARALAITDPTLGLHRSLETAAAARRATAQRRAIAKVLHRKIRAAVDPTTADIATAVYDMDQVAARLAAGADYDGLTALIAADLTAARIAGVAEVPAEPRPADDREPVEKPFVPATVETVPPSAPVSAPPTTRKRTPAETFRLAEALIKGDPELLQSDVADALGITARRLRDILRDGRRAALDAEETRRRAEVPADRDQLVATAAA